MKPDAPNNITNVLVTGGCGYIGSALVPALLQAGYTVTVLDLMVFGWQPAYTHPRLHIVEGDICDQALLSQLLQNQDAVIHLAFISNDPKYELDPEIGEAINIQAFRPLVEKSLKAGVKRFIFASSCSVYGQQAEGTQSVSETSNTSPLTAYAEGKLACEKILFEYSAPGFCTVALRPATVYGIAPRQRLDLTFNRMNVSAHYEQKILIPTPQKIRPCLHINDMVRLYLKFLSLPAKDITGQIWNAAFENRSLWESAQVIQDVFSCDIPLIATESADIRSYHVASNKLTKTLGFQPRYSLQDAAISFQKAFREQRFSDPLHNSIYYNLHMQKKFPWHTYLGTKHTS